MKNKKLLNICLYLLTFFLLCLPAAAQQDTPLELEKVAENIYCLYGPGGNIGILKTSEGLLVIDSKFMNVAEKVVEKITTLSDKPIKYLVNTHYHGDHTSGNEVIGKNAVIIAHKNCKASLINSLKTQKKEAGYTAGIKTYEKEKVIELGGEKVKLLYLDAGHTSGDTIVVFEKAKVIHTGDLFFNGIPPYIDVKDGSDTGNWIRTIAALNEKYPDYKIIPGHGKVTDMKSFLQFADYLKFLREEVAKAIKAGKTREQAVQGINFDNFKHMADKGFMSKKSNAGWVYDEMTRKK